MSGDSLIRWLVLGSGLVLDATVAYSRAGGGENYSSGGGSSSSSSNYSPSSSSYSGGSGGSESTLADLLVAVAIIAFAIYHVRALKKKQNEEAQKRRASSLAWSEVLEERDSRFDLDVFRDRVKRAFLDIQKGWSSQDLGPARGFMSDGLHERFLIQFREQQARGYRNRMSKVRVEEVCLIGVQKGLHLDTASVRIWARALDVRVDFESGRVIEGSRRDGRFSEVWSFVRGSDATSSAAGLFEGQCPNCSAPIDPKRAWACPACSAGLDTAPRDWVLSEITQSSEWSMPRPSEPGWLKQATRRDPGLTVQQLEDRASVLFWRVADSHRTKSVWGLERVCRVPFLEEHAKLLSVEKGRRIFDCAVGSVDLRGIMGGREFDLALLEIRWSGMIEDGVVGRANVSPVANHSLLVMARRAGAESQLGRSLASAHCSNCGGPDEDALDGTCAFCGEVLNDGRDWLIERFLRFDESEATILLSEVLTSGDERLDEVGERSRRGRTAIPLSR